jgi:hypothetical protein
VDQLGERNDRTFTIERLVVFVRHALAFVTVAISAEVFVNLGAGGAIGIVGPRGKERGAKGESGGD